MATPGERLGGFVKARRERLGLSQADLARAAQVRGLRLTRETIAGIETGRNDNPEIETLHALSVVLGVTRARLYERLDWIEPAEADDRSLRAELRESREAMREALKIVDRLLGDAGR